MSRGVVYLADVRVCRGDWSTEDLAHLGRAANFVRKLGLSVETDRGVTDEGEPWFVLCDADSGEVFAHFARSSGKYVVFGPCLNGLLTGTVLRDLVERFLDDCPCRRVAANRSHSTPAAG